MKAIFKTASTLAIVFSACCAIATAQEIKPGAQGGMQGGAPPPAAQQPAPAPAPTGAAPGRRGGGGPPPGMAVKPGQPGPGPGPGMAEGDRQPRFNGDNPRPRREFDQRRFRDPSGDGDRDGGRRRGRIDRGYSGGATTFFFMGGPRVVTGGGWCRGLHRGRHFAPRVGWHAGQHRGLFRC